MNSEMLSILKYIYEYGETTRSCICKEFIRNSEYILDEMAEAGYIHGTRVSSDEWKYTISLKGITALENEIRDKAEQRRSKINLIVSTIAMILAFFGVAVALIPYVKDLFFSSS